MLVEAGADVTRQNKQEKTPIELAKPKVIFFFNLFSVIVELSKTQLNLTQKCFLTLTNFR